MTTARPSASPAVRREPAPRDPTRSAVASPSTAAAAEDCARERTDYTAGIWGNLWPGFGLRGGAPTNWAMSRAPGVDPQNTWAEPNPCQLRDLTNHFRHNPTALLAVAVFAEQPSAENGKFSIESRTSCQQKPPWDKQRTGVTRAPRQQWRRSPPRYVPAACRPDRAPASQPPRTKTPRFGDHAPPYVPTRVSPNTRACAGRRRRKACGAVDPKKTTSRPRPMNARSRFFHARFRACCSLLRFFSVSFSCCSTSYPQCTCGVA